MGLGEIDTCREAQANPPPPRKEKISKLEPPPLMDFPGSATVIGTFPLGLHISEQSQSNSYPQWSHRACWLQGTNDMKSATYDSSQKKKRKEGVNVLSMHLAVYRNCCYNIRAYHNSKFWPKRMCVHHSLLSKNNAPIRSQSYMNRIELNWTGFYYWQL